MFRISSNQSSIEIRSQYDATPFSNSIWEKDLLVHATAISSHEELPLGAEAKEWNLYSRYGIEINKNRQIPNGANVAVLDTGIFEHFEFRENLLPGHDFISSNALSFDGDGRDNDFGPESGRFGDCQQVGNDILAHGTHVTGVISSSGKSEFSNVGVSPRSSILPIRVLGACGGSIIDVLEGMLWASGESVGGVPDNNDKISVVNLSLGGLGKCPESFQSVINQLNKKNIITVVAAGNSSMNLNTSDFFPANCSGVIAVGATNVNGQIPAYSNYGDDLVYAPGGDSQRGVLSTFVEQGNTLEGTYGEMMGTSMSAPHISGLVAIVKSEFPDLNVETVKDILKKSINSYGIVSYEKLEETIHNENFQIIKNKEVHSLEMDNNKNEKNKEIIGCGTIDSNFGGGSGGMQAVLYSLLAGVLIILLIESTRADA